MRLHFRRPLLAALFCALLVTPALASRHVVVVSLDGLRPDVALRANMPALRALMNRGSFTMYAATTDVAITLPSHTSMLTGVPPEQHGITYNADPRPTDKPAPDWPTLLEVAHRAGLTTAMVAGKSKFSVLCAPGALDTSLVPPRGGVFPDSLVAETADRWIRTRRPQVLFVHLPGLDAIGHSRGWGSHEQVAGAEAVDRAFARVLRALAQSGLNDSTLIIVSADHGGAGKTHGGLDPRSRLIPWIAAGPGVKHDFDLALLPATQVRTEDTFATAAAWMGIALEKPVVGRSVDEIFEGR